MAGHFTPSRRLSPAPAPLFAVFVAVLALSVAYYSQYVGGLHPCEMCHWQRMPYAGNIVLGLVAFLSRNKHKQFSRTLVWMCFIGLMTATGLGAFHAGVEYGWWEGPTACSGGLGTGMTNEELLAKILGAPSVSCKDAAVRVLSISMAGWNALYALCSAIILLILIRKSARRGR